jgi:glycosyltransferase involved in cell wall biosynthesis
LSLSLIVPVYNRPDEVDELLESLDQQTDKDFEVIIVEDGSQVKCDEQIMRYSGSLNISYYFKENSGPGQSRNYGSERANGNYFVFLDSDCVLPPQYIAAVKKMLKNNYTDAFGGPDKADENFSTIQKSINYAMTSFLTTGGIRGGGEQLDKFYPRSFNMGYSRVVFEKTKGFSKMRFGEDIDMSIRILKAGFQITLFREAYVFHKRRTRFRQFYKQVFNSGIARINLHLKHPGSLKMVHLLPSLFVAGCFLLIILALVSDVYFLIPILVFAIIVLVDAGICNKSLKVGLYAVLASFLQLFGYGLGFLAAAWKRLLFSKNEFSAFNESFYD